MKMSFVVFAVLLGMYNSAAFGAVELAKKVNHIHRWVEHTGIRLEGVHVNPAGCSIDYWYVIPVNHASHDAWVSIAMTALASDKVVNLYISDTVCEINMPLIDVGITISR